MNYTESKHSKNRELKDQYLTKKECAILLKVSQTTIDNLRRKKILKAYKLGQTVLFKREEVDNALIEV